jgi:hypothetical protein
MVTATAHMASCALEAKSSEITGELRSIIGDLREQLTKESATKASHLNGISNAD